MLGVGGGGDGGGGEGGGRRRGGGGSRRKGKQKVEETKEGAGNDEEGDEEEGGNVEGGNEAEAAGGRRGSTQQADRSIYRGVRRYSIGDGSYRATWVACLGTEESPHNNRQVWQGRYYDEAAAGMAVDIYLVFNHNDALVNFPQYLHYYTALIPRRGLNAHGTLLPVSAFDLERIKHIALGILRAFYPGSCAAVHTRRNHKALPSNDQNLTPKQRQIAASLQASYLATLEQQTYRQVLALLAIDNAVAQQHAGFGDSAGSGAVHAAGQPPAAAPAAAAAGPSLPIQAAARPPAAIAAAGPSLPPRIDFASIQLPPSAQQQQISLHPSAHQQQSPPPSAQQRLPPSALQQLMPFSSFPIDFSAIQLLPRLPPASPSIGNVRQAPTSPETLRLTAAREYAEAFRTPSPSEQRALSGHFQQYSPYTHHGAAPSTSHHSLLPPPSYFQQFSPYTHHGAGPSTSDHSPLPPPSHVTRPSPTHADLTQDPSILQSLGIYPRPADDPRQSWNPLIRSNIDPRSARQPTDTSSRQILFQPDIQPPLQREAGARINAARMRAETSQSESSSADHDSTFPLLQRVVGELAGAPYPRYGSEHETALNTHQRYGTASTSGGHASVGGQRQYSASDAIRPRPSHDVLRQGRPQSLSAFRSYNAPEQPRQSSSIEFTPLNTTSTSHAEEEDQRVVPLRRQSPQELPLFDVFARQASARGELGSHDDQLQTHEEGGPPSVMGHEGQVSFSRAGLSQHGHEGVEVPTTELSWERPEETDVEGRHGDVRPEIDLNIVSATSPEGESTASINRRELERVSTLGPAERHEQHSQPDQLAHDHERGGPSSPHLDKRQ